MDTVAVAATAFYHTVITGNYLTNQTAKQKNKNKKKRSINLKKRANLKRIGNLVVYYIIVG